MCFTTIKRSCFKKRKSKRKDTDQYIVEKKLIGYECLICLEEYDEGQTLTVIKCGHLYHTPCLNSWFIKKKTCPLCDEQLTI